MYVPGRYAQGWTIRWSHTISESPSCSLCLTFLPLLFLRAELFLPYPLGALSNEIFPPSSPSELTLWGVLCENWENQFIRLCLLEQFPFQSVYTLLAGDLTPKHLPSPVLQQSKPQLAIDSHSVNSVIWRDCPSNSPGPLPGAHSSQEYQLWSDTSLLVS